ncbi:hypothetical protein GCM10010331_78790 [Streptomyces xanthochromogenes]|uniref:hypothetical protein n=1 Tax=Streptomyces xanthochromogenes TaxID=67384 RepID=UPI0016730639|nr:hypothetical protein [Streptomyces xanthochromogenes]GHB79447.1 hypothetical protein GCM10010331_78790 [Streptomyces xanthochromogenes]
MTGIVLTGGRTRAWVERGALHWIRGRTTVVVPGAGIRRVEAGGKSLTVFLVEDAGGASSMTVRHRNQDMISALGAEIDVIIGDAGRSEKRRQPQRHTVPAWPVCVLTRLRDRVLHGNPWWRRALWYTVLGPPLAVLLPPSSVLGIAAWLLLPAGLGLLWFWVKMTDLDTRWVMRRRGVTVHARYEFDLSTSSDSGVSYIVHFRTLDGQQIAAPITVRGHRDEVSYDPRDPSRVYGPTRVAWLGYALISFIIAGMWGVAFCVPAIIWITKLVSPAF